jgi:pectin methylesterase-like acyl-CoA thioesterase
MAFQKGIALAYTMYLSLCRSDNNGQSARGSIAMVTASYLQMEAIRAINFLKKNYFLISLFS